MSSTNPEAPLIPDWTTSRSSRTSSSTTPSTTWVHHLLARLPVQVHLLQPAMLTGTTYRYKSAGRIVEELDILIKQYDP